MPSRPPSRRGLPSEESGKGRGRWAAPSTIWWRIPVSRRKTAAAGKAPKVCCSKNAWESVCARRESVARRWIWLLRGTAGPVHRQQLHHASTGCPLCRGLWRLQHDGRNPWPGGLLCRRGVCPTGPCHDQQPFLRRGAPVSYPAGLRRQAHPHRSVDCHRGGSVSGTAAGTRHPGAFGDIWAGAGFGGSGHQQYGSGDDARCRLHHFELLFGHRGRTGGLRRHPHRRFGGGGQPTSAAGNAAGGLPAAQSPGLRLLAVRHHPPACQGRRQRGRVQRRSALHPGAAAAAEPGMETGTLPLHRRADEPDHLLQGESIPGIAHAIELGCPSEEKGEDR